jgi:hypothetical protein
MCGASGGLNRFDGYKSKVFKHEPERSDKFGLRYTYEAFSSITLAVCGKSSKQVT